MGSILRILTFFIFTAFLGQSAFSQLIVGDIAFTGYTSEVTPAAGGPYDEFSFVILRTGGLPASTVIKFTDTGWSNTNPCGTDQFLAENGSTESTITWTSPGSVLAYGTQVTITGPNASTGTVVVGTTVPAGIGLTLTIAGDQIIAFQGTRAVNTIIAAISLNIANTATTTDADWDIGTVPGVSTCIRPPCLTNGVNAAILYSGAGLPTGTEMDNARLTCLNITGVRATDIAYCNTRANWSFDDNVAFALPAPSCCTNPTVPTLSATPATICSGSSSTITITGTLNSATAWTVYTGSCGGTLVGSTGTSSFVVSPTVTTTYYIRGEGGCVVPGSCATVTVTVNPIPPTPTISAGGATTFCAGGSVTLTSSSASGNQWYLNGSSIGGATNQTYSATASGNYTVIVTSSGCSSAASAITAVTVNPIPATPTISAGGATTFCAGGSVTLTSSSATGNQWYLNGSSIGGATNQTYVATASGNYTVIVTASGCSSAASAITAVTVNPIPPTPTISAGGPTTFCAGGSVTLTSSSATGNQWRLNGTAIGGATNQTYVATASGNYTVVVTASGCSSAASAITTVTVNPIPATPTISAGGATTFCAGGSVTLTSSSATGNQWYLNGSSIGGATNQTYVASASGNYTVIVTASGCPSAASAITTVTVNPIPATPTISAGGPTTFCAGGSVTLTSSSATGNQWYLNGSSIGGATNQTYSATASGNYTVIVTASGCSSAASAITAVTVNPAPPTPTISAGGPTTFCAGGSVTLTSSSATGNQWYLNGSSIGGATNQTLVVSASGNYTVIVTASGCPSAASAITTVTVNPIPATPTISAGGPTTFCAGGSVTLTSSSATGNQWYLNGSSIGGATNQTYSATASGNYTVVVTVSGCSSAASAITAVTVNPAPPTPTISAGGPTTFCAGGSVTLTSSSATGNQWYLNGSSIGGATNQTYVASASGNYTVIVTSGGCPSAASAITAVTVNPIPATPTISAGGPTTFCAGGSVTLTSSSATGNQWYLNGSSIGGATNQTYSATASGNYTVIVTLSGCSSAASAITAVTVNPLPATPTISAGGATTFCAGGSVTLTSSSATGNQWYLNGSSIGGATNQTYVASASGIYTVTVTASGCSSLSSAITTVTVNPIPATPTITPSGPTTFCAGGSVTLTSSSASGNQWYLNGSSIGGATNQTYSATASGNYTVIVTLSGCSSPASAITAVTVNPLPATPTISAGGATTFCAGGSVTLTSSSATGNQWYLDGSSIGGATNQTYVATVSGIYTVTVTASGCSSLSSAITTVTVNPIPATPTITPSGPTTFCAGGSVTLTSSSATGNQWYLNGSSIGGATNQTYSATASGNYTVIVTASGCSSAASAITTVTVNPIPATPTISAGGATTFCAGGSVTLTSSSATGNQWYLNGSSIGGATNQTFVASASGNYTVIVTASGCSSTASAITAVTVNPIPATPTISAGGATTFCAGGSVTLTSSSASGNQWYLNGSSIGGATNQTYSATASGNYTVIVTASGCSSTASAITAVTVNPIPATPTISAGGATTFCAGGSVTLTSSSATGNQWYLNGSSIGGATNQTFVASASGNYTVIVTASGCSSTASAITAVTVNPIPATPTISAGGTTTFCAGGSVTLTSSSATGNQWYLNGSSIGGATNQTYSATASGNYTVIVTASGCSSAASAITTVTVNPIPATPTISAGGATTFCAGGSVTLTSSSATGNQWYLNGSSIGGATNQTYSATASGNYTVIVTASGCSSVASAITAVTVNPIPATPTISAGGATTFCIGGSVTLTSSSATGNQWRLNGTAIGGATNQTYVATASGNYTVIVTSLGCASAVSATTTVTVNPLDNAGFNYGAASYCLGQTDPTPTITGVPGGTFSSVPAGLMLNPVTGFVNIALSVPGAYTVTYTTAGTCPNSSNQPLTISAPPASPSVVSPITVCPGADVILSATGSGLGSILYFNSVPALIGTVPMPPATTTLNIGPLANGAYVFNVSATNGTCLSLPTQINVNVNDVVAPTAVCQDLTVYLDGTGNATIPASSVDGGSTDNCGGVTLAVSPNTVDCGDVGTPAPNNMIITGVVDGPLVGGTPKAIEVYVINDIPDLSLYGLGSANNGGGTNGQEFTFPAGSATAGTYLFIATEAIQFTNFFGFAPNYVNGTAPNINGDDAIELFYSGSVIDIFGDINVDGSFTPWDYLDGWVHRNNGTGPDGTTFVVGNWTYSGINALDGQTSNATAPIPYPVATYTSSFGGATVTLTVTDGSGNSSTCLANVTVLDTLAPVLTCPGNITLECDQDNSPAGAGMATAIDNCDVAATISFSDLTTAGGCPQESIITRTWTATDMYGNASTCVQTITIVDTQAPVLTCPGNISLQCDQDNSPAGAGTATAIDNCDPSVAISFNDAVTPGGCPQQSVIARTWMAIDDCGNVATCVQTITIVDTQAPVITCPANLTLQCTQDNSPAGAGSATAVDNCDASVAISFSDAVTPGACPQELVIARTWSAVDDCGNATSCTQTITVIDTQAPTITCPASVTVGNDVGACSATGVAIGMATATDNCDPSVTITNNAPGTFLVGSTTVTWTATDDCGNSTTCTQTVTVVDNEDPTTPSLFALTGECTVTATAPTTNDNCAGVVIGTTSDPLTYSGDGSYVINWTFSDGNGNSIVVPQSVVINDNTNPAIPTLADVNSNCSAVVTVPTTTDNCAGVVIGTTSDPLTYTGAGSYVVNWTFNDGNGNSIVVPQNVNVANSATTSSITAVVCNSYTAPSGVVLTSSGIYTDIITNAAGCDSIITIDLTVNMEIFYSFSVTKCVEYTVPSGDETYYVSGVYMDTVLTVNGCDSIMSITVNIYTVDTGVTQSGITLTATAAGAGYQWIDCSTGTDIIGATSATFTPTYNGDFAVIVFENGCYDTSACYTIGTIGIDEYDTPSLVLYPNPSYSGEFNIEYDGVILAVQVVDMVGRVISLPVDLESGHIDGSMLQSGNYMVRIVTDQDRVLLRELMIVR